MKAVSKNEDEQREIAGWLNVGEQNMGILKQDINLTNTN